MAFNKKGELTTQQIVGLIILIVSFVIILYLIFALNLGETTDKEICHNSVALKDQSALASGPLNCKTSYVCISGGGECEGFSESRTIKVDLDKTQIYEAIANEMADCWWMFGEGKVNYAKGFDWSIATGEKVCSLCSIISFDKKVQEYFGDKTTVGDFYSYLEKTEKERGISYLYYLTKKSDYNTEDPRYKEPLKTSIQYGILTGISEKSGLSSIGNYLLGSIDDFNDIFFSWVDEYIIEIPKVADKKYGHFPVIIIPKENLGKLECTDFLTKA